MKQLLKKVRNERAIWVFAIAASLTWIWAFFVDASKLSESLVAGYGGITVVFTVTIIFTASIAWLFWTLIRRVLDKPSWAGLARIVLLWAAAEFVIAWAISLASMGRGSSWDSVLPFFSLTPAIMHTPLRFLSRVFGYYSTSAAVGTVILVMFFGKPWRRIAISFGLVLVLANLMLYGFYNRANGDGLNVVIVSESLGERGRIDTSGADLVLVPEYGLDSVTPKGMVNRFKAPDEDTYFSGTMRIAKDGRYYNSLIYGSSDKGVIEQRHKSRLVIGSEYLPYGIEFALKNFASETYYNFLNRRAIAPGKEKQTPFALPGGEVLGNAACSSILSTDDYRKLTGAGATILANSASLGVFNGSRQFELYHSGLAKFMATANARPFMQSANDWKAFALDHNGHEVAAVDPYGSKLVRIETNKRKTPYTYIGDLFAYAGVLLLVFMAAMKWRQRVSKKSNTSK